jgi:hypothetical protein
MFMTGMGTTMNSFFQTTDDDHLDPSVIIFSALFLSLLLAGRFAITRRCCSRWRSCRCSVSAV